MTSGTTACVSHYNQAGDSNYSAATEGTSSTTAQKASQVITVTTSAPGSAVFNTSFPVAATAPGGLVAIAASGACVLSGSTVTMTSGTGYCTVTFNQGGNGDYLAAPQVTQTTTAQKASQTITVTQGAPATAPVNTSFPVAATASSGAAVKIDASGACSLKGSKTVTTASTSGLCTVTFDQKGTGNYAAAPQVVQTTTVY